MITLTLALCCALAVGADAGAHAAAARPNVLFIAVDDLNDWLGCLGGHPQAHSPNFDRLAARGTLFTRAYCTAPACNPSRKSLLTGTRPSTTGLYYNRKMIRDVIPGVVTLPEHFMRNGYRVEGGGKIFHHGMEDPQSWHAYFPRPRDPEPKRKPHIGMGHRHHYWRWQPLEDADDDDMADGKLAAWTERFLAREHSEPFFLGVGFWRPHMPWHVPQKYFDRFPLESIQLPAVLEGDVDDLPPYGRWLAYERTGNHAEVLRLGQWELAVQAYLACIAFTDAMLGRVLDALDASPYAENTIIVLWSDNGMHLGEKQHWTKWGLWELATRVPLMIVAPGVTTPGGRCDTPVSLLDLYPTLIELCGLPSPPRPALEGESLVPLLRDPTAERTAPAITTHGHMNHAIRTARWRYIRYRDGSEELYDHDADPHEWKNLAGDARYAEVIAELQQWLPEVNVPDPPYLERHQYWPSDPAPDDVSDYPRAPRDDAATVLPAPGELAVEPGSASHADLRWADRTGGTAAHRIERKKTTPGRQRDWMELGTVPPGHTRFQSTGLRGGNLYVHRIRAESDAGQSGWVESEPVETPPMPEKLRGRVLVESTDAFPRNGEGDFLVLTGGELIYVYGRWTAPDDHAKEVCIGIIRSRDEGNTWSEPVTLFEEPGYDLYHASLVRMPGGEIGLSYTKRRSDKAFFQPCEKVFRYSADEGGTWSDEILISDGQWAWYQTSANDRLLLLESGRLLHPVSRLLTRGKGENEGGCGTLVYRSDDGGRTWQRATLEPVREPERDVFHEAALVEYAPGKVLMLGRTLTGWFWESRSEDGGQTWSEAARSPVRSSVAPPWLVRVPGTQTIGLAWCPYVGSGSMLGPRPVLGWQLSDDGGRTWYGYRELEQGPTRDGGWTGYCYGSGEWVGDTLHFAYMDHGGSSPLMRPRYQQLSREWLMQDGP